MIASLSISISMIQSSVEDWDKYPITTDVERTDGSHTADELYPAVTICRGTETQPNNWALSELILDFLAMWEQDFGPGERKQIHEDFSDLKDVRFKYLNEILENVYRKHELFKPYPSNADPSFKNDPSYFEIIDMIIQKVTNLSDVDSFLKKNMFLDFDLTDALMQFINELMTENLPNADAGSTSIQLM